MENSLKLIDSVLLLDGQDLKDHINLSLKFLAGIISFIDIGDEIRKIFYDIVEIIYEKYKKIQTDAKIAQNLGCIMFFTLNLSYGTSDYNRIKGFTDDMMSSSDGVEDEILCFFIKFYNLNEEKLQEIYERVTYILDIRDPDFLGLKGFSLRKMNRKYKIEDLMSDFPKTTEWIKKIIFSPYQSSFLKDNVLLEILRSGKEKREELTHGKLSDIYFDFLKNVKMPYSEYQFKILQKILSVDMHPESKNKPIVLAKLKDLIKSEKLTELAHKNLFMLYYLFRYLEILKNNRKVPEFIDLYFQKIIKFPIQGYTKLFFDMIQSKSESFTRNEKKWRIKFLDEFKLVTTKYCEFFFLPQAKLKVDSLKADGQSSLIFLKNDFKYYQTSFKSNLDEYLDKIYNSGNGNYRKLKPWYSFFEIDPLKTTELTFFYFFNKSKSNVSLKSLNKEGFLEPVCFLLLDKSLFHDIQILQIILQSLTIQLKFWEVFTREISEKNSMQYTVYLKNVIVKFLIEIISNLSKLASRNQKNITDNIAELCEYIHILCVEDEKLIENIIMEGFDFEIVETIIEGVEWMHACLFYKDQLLSETNHQKKIFNMLVLSHIIKKYPTLENHALAKRILEFDIKIEVECSQAYLSSYIYDCIKIITNTFPDLKENEKKIKEFYKTYTVCSFDEL